MFYRKASRSLRSRNTLRLFTFLKLRFWLLFRCSQIHNPNQDSKSKPHITKNQKFPKKHRCVSPQSLRSKDKLRILRFHTMWNFKYRRKTCGARRSLSFTASPGVKRARKPSVYFFGTFFVQAKKVRRRSAAAILANEQAKITNLILRENTPVFVP